MSRGYNPGLGVRVKHYYPYSFLEKPLQSFVLSLDKNHQNDSSSTPSAMKGKHPLIYQDKKRAFRRAVLKNN